VNRASATTNASQLNRRETGQEASTSSLRPEKRDAFDKEPLQQQEQIRIGSKAIIDPAISIDHF